MVARLQRLVANEMPVDDRTESTIKRGRGWQEVCSAEFWRTKATSLTSSQLFPPPLLPPVRPWRLIKIPERSRLFRAHQSLNPYSWIPQPAPAEHNRNIEFTR